MDQSIVRMRNLFIRLNTQNIELDISNFSKASKTRSAEVFEKVLNRAIEALRKKKGLANRRVIFSLDSTIISLTSKLLWSQ